jgi:hypothetical protein
LYTPHYQLINTFIQNYFVYKNLSFKRNTKMKKSTLIIALLAFLSTSVMAASTSVSSYSYATSGNGVTSSSASSSAWASSSSMNGSNPVYSYGYNASATPGAFAGGSVSNGANTIHFSAPASFSNLPQINYWHR